MDKYEKTTIIKFAATAILLVIALILFLIFDNYIFLGIGLLLIIGAIKTRSIEK